MDIVETNFFFNSNIAPLQIQKPKLSKSPFILFFFYRDATEIDNQVAMTTRVIRNEEAVGTVESDAQTSSNLIFLQAFSCTCDSVNVCATLIKNSCHNV